MPRLGCGANAVGQAHCTHWPDMERTPPHTIWRRTQALLSKRSRTTCSPRVRYWLGVICMPVCCIGQSCVCCNARTSKDSSLDPSTLNSNPASLVAAEMTYITKTQDVGVWSEWKFCPPGAPESSCSAHSQHCPVGGCMVGGTCAAQASLPPLPLVLPSFGVIWRHSGAFPRALAGKFAKGESTGDSMDVNQLACMYTHMCMPRTMSTASSS